ncbi:high-affinity Zn(2+) transporter zrt1 [Saitozyma podzolica]|uniref:High-affinity Zn(2+) transporter zrt1 n=1 Tax=Saitozyma podzolica TaxID=1890683 RepID=A0A427Y2T1_9TREE|nr:high-affinity Zn(2+) transporter zrt1 [Saitozyma podzolica]
MDNSTVSGLSAAASSTPDACALDNSFDYFGLRVGGMFIILVTSILGTLVPIALRQSRIIPRPVFEFAKFFGSGVIIATAFIHLLSPAWAELTSPCLSGTWTEYDWAPAIAMIAVYGIFFAEVAAYRLGTKRLERLGVAYSAHNGDEADAHAHSHQHDPPLDVDTSGPETEHHVHPSVSVHPRITERSQRAGRSGGGGAAVAVLEFGVVLHSVIIGLTLAVSSEFPTLFVVIIFHQMFEGLGLGSRLAGMSLPDNYRWTRYAAALVYAFCTPIGIAVGLGLRQSYNGNGVSANIASGILDATSAGILLYTGLVELMAHEIILNPRMMKSSTGRLTYVFGCMMLGSGLMALLGGWA